MTKTSGALTLVVVLLTAASSGAPATRDAEPAPPRVGTISGTVTLEPPPPPRRSANRGYTGSGSASHAVQRLPAVVYLKGAVAGAPPLAAGSERVMAQRDTAFVPSGLAVTVGSTVSFPNQDPFFHNVFSYSSAKRFDLGRYPEGETKEVAFDEPGVVELLCEVHDFMRGVIVVTENPYHAVVGEDGAFSIPGVPAGEHTVVFWHADHDTVERTIAVTDGAETRVGVELRR